MMAFIGVRSSWLIFARKLLLAWLASLAVSIIFSSSAVRTWTFCSNVRLTSSSMALISASRSRADSAVVLATTSSASRCWMVVSMELNASTSTPVSPPVLLSTRTL